MITDYIPKGYENRVSRGYLGGLIHEKDREAYWRIEVKHNEQI